MRVKIFESNESEELEANVNEFLASGDFYGILDVKLSECSSGWTVLVLYYAKGED